MTLPFGTKVTDRNADPNVVGLVLRLANDAAEYGEEEYVIRWQSGMEELLLRRDLNVVPDPNALRVVRAEAVRDGDWIWGHYRADADCKVIVWPTPCQKESYIKTTPGRNYILGPDPTTLLEGL